MYDFRLEVGGTYYNMRFTSVLGHVKGIKFPEVLSEWATTPFDKLYSTPIQEYVLDASKDVAKNLK